MERSAGSSENALRCPRGLTGVLVLQGIWFLYLFLAHRGVPVWESAFHLQQVFRIANDLREVSGSELTLLQALKSDAPYPPLLYYIGALIAILFENSVLAVLLLSPLFVLIATFFVYNLSFLLSRDSQLSFYSALFFALFPLITLQGRGFYLDLPMMAGVFGCWFFLLRFEKTGMKRDVLLSAAWGLAAQLFKWSAIAYVGMLGLFVFVRIFRARRIRENQRFFFWIGVLVVLCSLGSLVLIESQIQQILQPQFHGIKGEIIDWTQFPKGVKAYLQILGSVMICWLPLCLSIIGQIDMWLSREKNRLLIFYLFWGAIGGFSFVTFYRGRYVLPLLFPAAFAIAYVTTRPSWIRMLTRYVCVVYACAMLFLLTTSHSNSIFTNYSVLASGPFTANPELYWPFGIDRKRVDYEPVIRFIAEDAGVPDRRGITILVLRDGADASISSFDMAVHQLGYRYLSVKAPLYASRFQSEDQMLDYLRREDVAYAVVPETQFLQPIRNIWGFARLRHFFMSRHNRTFQRVKEFHLGNEERLGIYRMKDERAVGHVPVKCSAGVGAKGVPVRFVVRPGVDYLFFTAQAKVNSSLLEHKPHLSYVVWIHADSRVADFELQGLPDFGASMCQADSGVLGIHHQIETGLRSDTSCGEKACEQVVLVDWNVSARTVNQRSFTLEDFEKLKPSDELGPGSKDGF